MLFHDSLGCVELWRDFPEQLSQQLGRTVIAYDRLGFGRSDPHRGRLGMNFIADEANRFFPVVCEQMGVHEFVAFGHSVGGGMAVHCAAEYADRCSGLVTESAQSFTEDRTLQGIGEAKDVFSEAGQLDRVVKYHGHKAQWVLDAWIDTWLDPAFRVWSLESVLPQVTCSVLAIHGELDPYGSTQHPHRIARLDSGPTQLELLQGVHHVPHREVEGHVLEVCAKFLATVP